MALKVALALSGLEPEQWTDDFGERSTLFSYGVGLPKSPSSSSVASSSGASSYYSMESGISSMSPDSASSSSSYHQIMTRSAFETMLLNALEKHKEIKIDSPPVLQEERYRAKPERKRRTDEIIYGGRDLLDLASNISGGWNYQTARLPDDVGSYFENRSQYSRLQGAQPPHHKKTTCADRDCSFVEPIYF